MSWGWAEWEQVGPAALCICRRWPHRQVQWLDSRAVGWDLQAPQKEGRRAVEPGGKDSSSCMGWGEDEDRRRLLRFAWVVDGPTGKCRVKAAGQKGGEVSRTGCLGGKGIGVGGACCILLSLAAAPQASAEAEEENVLALLFCASAVQAPCTHPTFNPRCHANLQVWSLRARCLTMCAQTSGASTPTSCPTSRSAFCR